jgi:hypothetical protein
VDSADAFIGIHFAALSRNQKEQQFSRKGQSPGRMTFMKNLFIA